MATPQENKYVTDGYHIYIDHPEYDGLKERGVLKYCDPPVVEKARPLSARKQAKLEAARKKALADAQQAVELFKAPVSAAEVNAAEDDDADGATGATGGVIDLDE